MLRNLARLEANLVWEVRSSLFQKMIRKFRDQVWFWEKVQESR